jgi:hypothetical protein
VVISPRFVKGETAIDTRFKRSRDRLAESAIYPLPGHIYSLPGLGPVANGAPLPDLLLNSAGQNVERA